VTILRTGSSTFNRAAAPSKSYGQAARLNLHADNPVGTGEFVYLQFGLPKDLHKGATVTSAHLRVQQDGDWTPVGPRTLTKQRINAKWLLSTIKWVNRPGLVTGTDVALTQSTVGDLAVWDWDVTTDVQAWVNGAPNYGWRIIADVTSTRYLRGFTARTGRPALVVEYAYPPAAPTSLHPSAGAVSVAKPVVRFDTGDITDVEVQVDPAANATTPAFDSGWVATTAAELNLAATTYAGLALNASTQWRVRVRNDAGLVSKWSQWVTFSRVAKPALTITQPTGTVLESTPPITWTMAGMVEYQVTVALASKPSTVIHDSGRKAGTSPGAYTPPKPVFTTNGASYVITVGGWDNVDREYTTGDPRRSEATTAATLTDAPGIVAVDWVTAQQQTYAPWVDIVWQRPAMPDGWVIIRDGERIHDTSVPGDLNVSGTTYTYRDWTAAPNREHTYRVAPVENGTTARGGPTDTVTPEIAGIWLGDPDTGDDVMLFGNDDIEPNIPDEAETFEIQPLAGTVTGFLTDALDRSAVADIDTMYRFKGHPSLVLRLAWADANIPVGIRNIQPTPRRGGGTTPNGITRTVSFTFKQAGELPYDVGT
jgi:hypothetical protein